MPYGGVRNGIPKAFALLYDFYVALALNNEFFAFI